jgi:hypothetical protein
VIADPTSPSLASSSPIDFKAIDFGTAAGVVEGIRFTAQKVWNIELHLTPTQSALTQVVQDAVSNYYSDDTRASGDQQAIGLVNAFSEAMELILCCHSGNVSPLWWLPGLRTRLSSPSLLLEISHFR